MNISEDKKTIKLAVPIGGIVYRFFTRCGDYCALQPEVYSKAKNTLRMECRSDSPCHTKEYGVEPIEVSLKNLEFIFANWQKTVFATRNEARNAMKAQVEMNRNAIKAAGFNPNW